MPLPPALTRLLLGLCAAALPACAPSAAQEAVAPFPVRPPEIRTVSVEHDHVATLAAVRSADLRARVDGVLEAVHVDEGRA